MSDSTIRDRVLTEVKGIDIFSDYSDSDIGFIIDLTIEATRLEAYRELFDWIEKRYEILDKEEGVNEWMQAKLYMEIYNKLNEALEGEKK